VAELAKWLGAQDPSLPKATPAPELRAKRAKVLAAFGKAMGWPEGVAYQADHWAAINGWLARFGAVKKRFNHLSGPDLQAIIGQLGMVLEHNAQSAFAKEVNKLVNGEQTILD
jgi:hypothetical protein